MVSGDNSSGDNSNRFDVQGSSSEPERLNRKPPALVIGIDFGTFASGFAYRKESSSRAFNGGLSSGSTSGGTAPLRISTHDRWPDQPTLDAKTRTALLYKQSKVVAWGWTAWKRWAEMSANARRRESYSYIENFKLLLEDGASEGVDTVCQLPVGVTRVQAVADYLSEMRKYIRNHFRRTLEVNYSLTSDKVVWCLTVPAIWSDAAKARMRDAAHRAGMTIQTASRSLSLVLEPEAAALAAVVMGAAAEPHGSAGSLAFSSLRRPSLASCNSLRDGDVLLVLDCGGGTADATLHRVRGSGTAARLEEAAMGRGALAGGAHVDAAAWTYIRELLGPETWDVWKDSHPEEVVALSRKWELSKRSFICDRQSDSSVASPPLSSFSAAVDRADDVVSAWPFSELVKVAGLKRNDIRLPLLPGLLSSIGLQKLQVLKRPSNTRGWVTVDQALVLPAEVVARQIFDPVVDKIIELMHDVMRQGAELGNTCNKVLLVGGFARSLHLQSRVRAALSTSTSLLLPSDPGVTVVIGAVVFGVVPHMVTARRCRVGYGIGCSRLWEADDARHAAHHNYPTKFWHTEDQKYYTGDAYYCFVDKGQLVGVDELVKEAFRPPYSFSESVSITLYSTTDNTARYIRAPGVSKHASIYLNLPRRPGLDRHNRPLEVEMRFGGTELSVVATDKVTNNSVATSIRFDAQAAL